MAVKKICKMKKIVEEVNECRFDITNMPQNIKGLEHLEFYLSEKNKVVVEKTSSYEVFLFVGEQMCRVVCKNQDEVVKIIRKFAFGGEFAFSA